MAGIGQDPDYRPLNRRVKKNADDQSGEQSKRHVPARVVGFSHRCDRRFKSTIGKDEQHHRFEPGVCGSYRRRRNRCAPAGQIDDSGKGDCEKRKQFGDCEHIAGVGTATHAKEVDDSDDSDQKGQYDQAW